MTTQPESTRAELLKTISSTDDPDELAAMAGMCMEEIQRLFNSDLTRKGQIAHYQQLLENVRDQQRLIWNRNSREVQA